MKIDFETLFSMIKLYKNQARNECFLSRKTESQLTGLQTTVINKFDNNDLAEDIEEIAVLASEDGFKEGLQCAVDLMNTLN